MLMSLESYKHCSSLRLLSYSGPMENTQCNITRTRTHSNDLLLAHVHKAIYFSTRIRFYNRLKYPPAL